MADTNQILRLAAIIREVDGTHSKGAAALAESILDHPNFCECYQPAPPADGEVAELPPRPPLITPPAHPALERYGITWDGSREKPVLTLLPDGYWTPWHVAAELLQRVAPVPAPPDGDSMLKDFYDRIL